MSTVTGKTVQSEKKPVRGPGPVTDLPEIEATIQAVFGVNGEKQNTFERPLSMVCLPKSIALIL